MVSHPLSSWIAEILNVQDAFSDPSCSNVFLDDGHCNHDVPGCMECNIKALDGVSIQLCHVRSLASKVSCVLQAIRGYSIALLT